MHLCFIFLKIVLVVGTCILEGIPLDQATIADNSIIAVYNGTFDPFHKGHEQVVDTILTEKHADYVVITNVDHLNFEKPFRSSKELRQLMIDTLYADNPQVLTCNSWYHPALDYLLEQFPSCQLVGVMGSDSFLGYKRRPFSGRKPKVQHWLVATRAEHEHNQELNNSVELHGTPITLLSIHDITKRCSSRKIRQYLHEHPEFYTQDSAVPINKLPLSESVQAMIKTFQLYLDVPFETLSNKQICIGIKKKIDLYKDILPCNYIFEKSSQKTYCTESGNIIFAINNEDGHVNCIVKAFTRHDHTKEYMQTLYAHVLDNVHLMFSKIPDIYGIFSSQDYDFIIMEPAQGSSLFSRLYALGCITNAIKRAYAFKEIICLIEQSARSLAELHVKSAAIVKSDGPSLAIVEIQQQTHNMLSVLKQHTSYIPAGLVHKIDQSMGATQTNWTQCLIHGCLESKNIIMGNQVTFIDLAKAHN